VPLVKSVNNDDAQVWIENAEAFVRNINSATFFAYEDVLSPVSLLCALRWSQHRVIEFISGRGRVACNVRSPTQTAATARALLASLYVTGGAYVTGRWLPYADTARCPRSTLQGRPRRSCRQVTLLYMSSYVSHASVDWFYRD
jgi:hypothetical protein